MANDMTILYGIIALFVITGALLPSIKSELSTEQTTAWSSDAIITEQRTSLAEDDSSSFFGTKVTSFFKTILSIASMFLWTFGLLPWYIDLVIFVPLRLIAYVIIARNVWIGGGG